MKKIIVLIGGVSKGSLNRRLFEATAALAADRSGAVSGGVGSVDAGFGGAGSSLEFTVFDIAGLPFFSQDIEDNPPASVISLRDLVAASDGVLIVTPEYNRSVPGVLKNALDWGSRPVGHNVWAHKPTAIMGAATGAIGTFGAQQHLRNICSWLDMPVMNQPAVFINASTAMMDASGTPTSSGNRLTDSSAGFIRKFLAAFEQWISTFA